LKDELVATKLALGRAMVAFERADVNAFNAFRKAEGLVEVEVVRIGDSET